MSLVQEITAMKSHRCRHFAIPFICSLTLLGASLDAYAQTQTCAAGTQYAYVPSTQKYYCLTPEQIIQHGATIIQGTQPTYPQTVQPTYPQTVQPTYPQTVQPTYPQTVQPAYPQTVQPIYPQTVQPIYPQTVQPNYGAPGYTAINTNILYDPLKPGRVAAEWFMGLLFDATMLTWVWASPWSSLIAFTYGSILLSPLGVHASSVLLDGKGEGWTPYIGGLIGGVVGGGFGAIGLVGDASTWIIASAVLVPVLSLIGSITAIEISNTRVREHYFKIQNAMPYFSVYDDKKVFGIQFNF